MTSEMQVPRLQTERILPQMTISPQTKYLYKVETFWLPSYIHSTSSSGGNYKQTKVSSSSASMML